MQKTFDAYEKATIKNAAKAVVNYCQKKEKVEEKITALQKEAEEYEKVITRYEDSVKELTGGYFPLELCEKVSRGSQNDWVFKYPATIVPPVQAEVETEEKKEEGEKEEKEEQASTVENQEEAHVSMPEDVFGDEQPSVEDPFAEEPEDFPAQEEDDRFNPDEF